MGGERFREIQSWQLKNKMSIQNMRRRWWSDYGFHNGKTPRWKIAKDAFQAGFDAARKSPVLPVEGGTSLTSEANPKSRSNRELDANL